MDMLLHGNALLALAAAVLWGGGDFAGGMGAKHSGGTMGAALRVILLSHAVQLLACWWRLRSCGAMRFRMGRRWRGG